MTAKKYYRPAMLDQILGRGGHRIIDASAGTGKTFAIEHVVADLILTGTAKIDQILVVTFTEKATAELRCRIRSTIETVLAGEAADATRSSAERTLSDDERGRLESALFAFYTAPVHTIHSFCHRMLTELAFESGVRFGLDLASGRLEFHNALRAELRERLKSDAVVQNLVDDWLSDEKRDADALENLLWSAHQQRYLRSSGRELNRQALADFIACLDPQALADAYNVASITPQARDRALDATRELERIVSAAAGATGKLAASLRGFDFARILKPDKTRKRSNRFPQDMSSNVRAITEAIERVEASLAIEARVADELLPGVLRRMDARKRERGTLDYEDMLAWLANALEAERGQSLAAALRDRYRVVLIDEFQDTDQLQWTIFRRVFIDDTAGNTVYVIGDPKQAIYAFRGADVHAYLEACQHLSAQGAKIVHLRENFRSTADMIDACNLIFDQNAREPVFDGEIKYQPPVTCGKKALRAVAPNGKQIAPITLIKFNPGGDRYRFSRRMREAIGVKIAREIRSIINDADSAIALVDGREAPRQVTAKDIYVLTRSNRDSAEIAKYLRQAGVPCAFWKQDGLFQTREATWILDLLRGIEDPGRRSSRLKAWASPFFAVDYADLARLEDDRNSHPMLERLFEWRALAEAGRFAELFDALLHQSGLAERELLSADSHRELTNYEHIFEILTHDASRRGILLSEIIDLLDAYISGRAIPPGDDPNVQRVQEDRCAVKIMTIHKSKGLEADVVALYGGFYANTRPDPVSIYHLGNERRLAIGKPAREMAKSAIAKEKAEEDQRLLYVALTRARAKLLLPYIPTGALRAELTGCYKQLNNRLRALETDAAFDELFDSEPAIAPPRSEPRKKEKTADQNNLCDWLVSTAQSVVTESEFADLGLRHRGLIIESYTSLQAADPDEFKTSVDTVEARTDNADLPGGRRVGIFLHEVIEKLDFKSFYDCASLDSWMARDDVRELFASAMRRHGVSDARWLDRGREIVFNALTSPVAMGDATLEGGLYRMPGVREMEFAYPIPEKHHALLGDGSAGAWTVGRGYLKGFIDLVFRRGTLMYFADWKGDLLPSYAPAAIARHVERHYRLQARIYSVGVVRLLSIQNERDYESRFGGLLYVFLRGVSRTGNGKSGFYFARPTWNEIVTYEADLSNPAPGAELRV